MDIKIFNTTTVPVTLVTGDRKDIIAPSELYQFHISVKVTPVEDHPLCQIPGGGFKIFKREYDAPTLPEYDPTVFYIVDIMVKFFFPDRKDLVCAGGVTGNQEGAPHSYLGV